MSKICICTYVETFLVNCINWFIHSSIPAISIAPLQVLYHSEALPTTARILYGSFTRSSQATTGKGLAQGLYVTAKAGVESMTLRLKVIDSTKAPSRPTFLVNNIFSFKTKVFYTMHYFLSVVAIVIVKNRNRKMLISRAPTKQKSQEPAYSQALNQNKIDKQRSRSRESGRQTAMADGSFPLTITVMIIINSRIN